MVKECKHTLAGCCQKRNENVKVAFKFLNDDTEIPIGLKSFECHIIMLLSVIFESLSFNMDIIDMYRNEKAGTHCPYRYTVAVTFLWFSLFLVCRSTTVSYSTP